MQEFMTSHDVIIKTEQRGTSYFNIFNNRNRQKTSLLQQKFKHRNGVKNRLSCSYFVHS